MGSLRAVTIDREEFIGDIAFTANSPAQLSTKAGALPNDRFIFGLRLSVEFRATNPGAGGPTAVLADAPFSLLDKIHIEGFHRGRSTKEAFYDLHTPDARELNLIYSQRAPTVTILANGAAVSSMSVAASATNDVRFFVDVIFPPESVPAEDQLYYLLDAPNYNDLALTLYWADDNSLFSGQTTHPTFSAFGSATGSPRCRVVGMFAQAGKGEFRNFIPARVWRYYSEAVSGDIVGGNTGSRLFNVNTGYRIRSLLLKTGVLATTTSGSNRAFASLSDSILSNLYIMRGTNKMVRYFPDFAHLKEATANAYAIKADQGYGLFDFAKRGKIGESMSATSLVAGPSGDTDFFIKSDIVGAANQAAALITQEIRGVPIVPR